MSENKYRDYLTDDKTFYRQYLKNEDEPVGSSSFTKIITGAAAAVGLAAGAGAAYRRGAFRQQLEYLIDRLGDYRQTRIGSTLESVRNWTKDDYWKDIQQMDSLAHRMIGRMQMTKELPRYLAEGRAFHDARMAELRRNLIIQDRPFELHAYTRQFESTLRRYEEGSNDIRRQMELNLMRNETRKLMDDAMSGLLVFDREKQEALMRRTGYRQATVRDVWEHLPVEVRRDLEKFERQLASRGANYSIMDKIIDSNILVKQDEKGNIVRFADLRDFRHSLARSMDTLAEDFTIPFIKINPLRMFYLNEFTKNDIPRVFADMSKSKVQPYVNRNGVPFIGDSVFVNGRLYAFRYEYDEKGNLIGGHFVRAKNPGYLVSARFEGRGSLLARSTKNMMNLYDIEFTPPQGFFKRRIWRPIAEFLDIGFQDERIGHDPEMGDPASYFSWLARKLHDGFGRWSGWKPYESKIVRDTPFGEGAEWLFIPRYKTLKEVNESGGGVKDYFAQFFAGRNNPEDVTTASFIFYTFAERLNATLNQVGVGLNAKHLGSAPQILWNLTMRRVAPVVVGVEAIKYSNYLYENIFGEEYEDQLAHLFVETQLDLTRISEKLGITEWAKDMTQILPGFEFISELPIPAITTEGLTPIMLRDIFPLDKTEEELREYYESGEEPVRKGRYWEFGTTPFVGGKIDYFQPNWYRRITSDWQYTETLWGSKEEYWDNHWLISPLNHFFLDPYHWEKRTYKDRPYPITGGIPEIENFPLIGPILNATIGQILKPEIIMHQEELQNPGVYRERLGFQLAEALGIIESNTGSPLHNGGIVGVHSGLAGAQAAVQVYSGVTEEKFSGRLEKGEPLAYVTASGQVQIMASTGEASISEINRMLDKSGIAKTGTAEEVELAPASVHDNSEEYANPGMINLALNDFHYNMTEMAGFYGWVSTLFTDRKEAQYEPQLISSSKAFGYERAFWDKDYGNLGADAMEIFRRFIPRDEHKNYLNPLDNRMPTWLPGPEYFISFQEGDPYVKVKKGEMRLPGEAYERLYGIDSEKLMDLEIGASFIGYDVKTIINHWLHRDDVKDNEDDLEGGTKLHKKLEKEFKEEGITVKTEQRVKDNEHKIYGFYDMYADQRKLLEWAFKEGIEIQYYRAGKGGGEGEYEGYYSSPETITPEIAAQIVAQSPYATVDIKTRSDKQFQKGELHFENAQQVNFYAHHIGTAVNAIIEYNRDDPEAKPKLYLFDYNPYLYEYSVNKVEVARAAVRQMLEDGAIGRGDLYGPVDRYRILADVAPYSEEFRKLKAQLSRMDLSEAEREEIRRINKQLSARKEAVRTYDYRFKTANVKDMTVTVKKVIDNNMFLTEEFGEHPIRLAGVYVPTGKDEKGEAARKFIRQYIREGVRLRIAVDADEQNLINDDTYQTISAVVRVGNIRNLNRELIERGLAKEKENDYSPTGVHARFSPAEIAFGKAWETFAHLDTPIHCVAPWTEIITDNGIKRADILQPGDKVLTHEGRFKPVMAVEPQGIGKRIVDIHLKSSNIPLTVTDDHPILAVKHERKKRITSRGTGEKLEPYERNPVPKFIFAGDLEAYDYVVYVPRKMVNENATPIIDVLQLNPDRFIEKEGYVYTASGDKYGNLNIKKNGLSLPRFFPVDGNFARLLGYYAAEGCTAKTRGNLTYTLFTFDQDEEEYIQDVCRISEQLFGVTPYIQRKKGTRSVTVRIGCSFLAEMVSKYIGHKTEKRAPEELLINKSLRAEFLRGLLRGDGTKAGYTKYDCIGMAAVQILLWVRDALFDLWKIPSSISLGIQRKNPLYILYIGKYPELVDFIDGYMEYEEKVFKQPYENRDKCVVGEWIFYRIKSVETSEYQLETIDIEVADDDTFSTINMAVHNTKLLQVRSPLEQYERREVFGKDWQDWANPMEDYFIPWYQNWISKSPVAAVTLGTVIGSLFGSTRFGRIMGALIGGTASLLGVTYVQAVEGLTGERWIPHRRMQEREIEEYFDMLKYVKFRALYEQAADMALEKEGFDVRAYLAEQKKEGEARKKRLQELREIKRGLLAEKHDAIERAKEIVGRRPNVEAYMKAINQEIEKLQNARKAERITPIAAQAIQYYNESERTMYAYDPGDPIENVLAALPRKERLYLTKFLKAPEEERERILETVPSYVRRVLQAAWGMKVDEKPDIVEYFTHHQLPGPDWAGWDPRANLDDIKLKLVKREGLDLSEFNFWPEDEKRAERIKDSVVPNIDMETTAAVVRKKLREVLGEAGFRNLQVDVVKTKEPGVHMDIDVLVDRRQEIIQQLNENGYSLI